MRSGLKASTPPRALQHSLTGRLECSWQANGAVGATGRPTGHHASQMAQVVEIVLVVVVVLLLGFGLFRLFPNPPNPLRSGPNFWARNFWSNTSWGGVGTILLAPVLAYFEGLTAAALMFLAGAVTVAVTSALLRD